MNKQVLGKAFKKDQKFVIDALTLLDETTAAKIEKDFEESGETQVGKRSRHRRWKSDGCERYGDRNEEKNEKSERQKFHPVRHRTIVRHWENYVLPL